MSRYRASVLGALLAFLPMGVFADGVPFAIRAPLPQVQNPLPVLPKAPTGFHIHAAAALPVDEGGLKPIVNAQSQISAFGIPCNEKMQVMSGPGAMLIVEITAPCKPHAPLQIEHAGLHFDHNLTYAGTLVFSMPALEPTGTIFAHFGPEQSLEASAQVRDFSEFTRLAIAWEEGAEMSIQAKAPDHLPVTRHRLGSQGGLHILSYHQDPLHQAGVVRLALARPVDAASCAVGSEGSVLKLSPGLPPLRYKLKLAAPGCAQIGEMFLLKNILQDLKLAGR